MRHCDLAVTDESIRLVSSSPMTDEAPPFFTRYGLSRTGDPDAPLAIEPYPEIVRGGTLLPTVIASAVDIVGSLHARELAGNDATFTTDLSIRAPARFVPGRVVARGEILRSGRTTITSGVRLEAEGRPFAYGESSFIRMPRRQEPREPVGMPEVIPSHPLERPLAEEVGVGVLDAAAGLVGVELRPALQNGEGVMQGALVALLAEVAAETLAEHHHGAARIVTELDVRYLAGARVGPIEAQAHWVGEPDAGMQRVALRDRGNGDKRTAVVLARTEPAVTP